MSSRSHEPEYKQWLQTYYLGLGYQHKASPHLRFQRGEQGKVVVDELNDMYAPLHQLVPCKVITFDKML